MRIGYLGGSFDPVHRGHLALAEAARAGAALDRVVLVVAGIPPHKPDRRLAPAPHRVAMARLAAEPHPWLEIDDRETTRSGPSYTLDTVRSLRVEHADDELFWIVGGDTTPEISTWREVGKLVDLVAFVVALRPGHDPEDGLAELAGRLGPETFSRFRSTRVTMRPETASSTEVRRRLRGGESIEDLVPAAVRAYIEAQGLYA